MREHLDRALGRRSLHSAQRRSIISSARLRTGYGVGLRLCGNGAERNLFPGALAIVLAAAAFAFRPRRLVFIYFAIAALSIELSFGLNGRVYSWLFDHVGALQGFRAPARFAVIACCAIAVLAGFGADVLFRRLSAAGAGVVKGAVALTFLLLAIEYRNTGMILTDVVYDPPTVYNVYKAVRTLGPGAVVELPLPSA